jgi:exosortase K
MNAMMKINPKAVVQFVAVLTAALALKQYYSTASANDLRWMLWPTTCLVEMVTGTRFYFESYAGYMSSDHTFLIAAPCAGVNFLIAAFLLLSIRTIWIRRERSVDWLFLPLAAAAAYALTIIANATRITSALWLNEARPALLGFDREEIHRLDGIFIYFGFLLLLFAISEKLTSSTKAMRPRHYLFPLAVYYAMTLAVPLANGAFRQGPEFGRHAMFVLLTPVLLILFFLIPSYLFSRYTKRKNIAVLAPFFPNDLGADDVGTRPDVRDAATLSSGTIGLEQFSVVADR